MDRLSFIQSTRGQAGVLWGAGVVCLVLAVYTLRTTPAPVEFYNVPKFSDPAATAYASKVARFCDQYMKAVHEASLGRGETKRELEAHFAELQAGAQPVVQRLPPEDARRFTEFMSRCGQTLVDADTLDRHGQRPPW